MRKNDPKLLIVHHTGGTDADPLADTSHHTFEIVNDWHKQNPNVNLGYPSSLGFYIGYHYFIDATGKVTQGRLDSDEGAHTVGKNTTSLGICLAGNFDATLPTKEQVAALKTLLSAKMEAYAIPLANVVPHRTYATKTCYGRKLSDTWAQELLKVVPPPPPTPTPPISTPSNDSIRDEIRTHLQAVDTLLGKLK